MMKRTLFVLATFSAILNARTLEVGVGKQYARLQAAAAVALPDDTLLLAPGIYAGGDAIANVHGAKNFLIVIRAENKGEVVYRGGSQAFQLSDVSYLRFENLVFEQQSGNGVNVDDAGTFETPTHHIAFVDCEWRSMNATGNNDELKLSGVDDFEVIACVFRNGATGGSLVDMVGCHRGSFVGNHFENAGSNAIQTKGASSDILIYANTFINAGERAINIGGSTGLAFFRPPGANYEAKAIRVYANVFRGSVTPIAYVGAVECQVHNNTIYQPTRWVLRILQENTSAGFLPCSNNTFKNNCIVIGNTGTVAINVGPNTDAQSFSFAYNLWYNPDNGSWGGPNTPVSEPGRILNRDPQFVDTLRFELSASSPAFKAGDPTVSGPSRDRYGRDYRKPPSIGALEVQDPSMNVDVDDEILTLYPHPVRDILTVRADRALVHVQLVDLLGRPCRDLQFSDTQGLTTSLDLSGLELGTYFLCYRNSTRSKSIPVIVAR